jgi:hypothetical protein
MRRRTLAVGAVVLGGAALVLFCCAGHGDRPATTPAERSPSAAETGTQAPSPAPTAASAGNSASAALAAGSTEPDGAAAPGPSDAGTPTTSSARPAGPGALIAETVHAADARDLELLAAIERDLKRDPPPEIHALITARKRGASRDALTRDIRALPDLRLRVLAMRWLDAVAPADAGAP